MGWLIALAVVVLILVLKISVRVRMLDDVALWLGVGIFRIKLFPSKEKNLKLSDYKIKKFRKNKAKEEAAARKNKKKKSDKKEKSKEQNTTDKVKKVLDKSSDSEKPKRDIIGLVTKLIEVVKIFFARFGHHLHINVKRVHIIVASPDAATTAMLYGAVCGAVQCLLELLYNCIHLKLPKSEELQVVPDFTSEKLSAEVDITFSFRLWQLFDIMIRSGWTYIKQIINDK